MWLFKKAVADGSPWLDYKSAEKTGFQQVFVFRIEEFLYFVLREICVTFPAVNGNRPQLPMKVSVQLTSTQNQFTPVAVPPELFSSPSQDFRAGTLDEDAQGMRIQAMTFNYPCDKAENIIVTVSGAPVGFVVGCMLTGRKHTDERGKTWL